uniref:Uncharacterized protein n=1 Tax=Molossus molossus TaxID=27622 RepID=A0A7J8I8N0_MOLMO|nr:hypothetical protein HJG59_010537 [Molossus molossus]
MSSLRWTLSPVVAQGRGRLNPGRKVFTEILVPRLFSGLNQMLVLIRNSSSGQRVGGRGSEWKYLDFSLLASQTGVLTTTLPKISSHLICVPPPASPPLSGGVHEHASSSPTPSVSAGPSRALECLLFTPRPAAVGSHHSALFSFPSAALFPGTDVECLGMSTRIYCLHCFLCMTLYAVSMLKKKTEKKKNHSAKPIYMSWTKIIECILSVRLGNTSLPLCAFGLCVAVFCQHEILSPLEDFRGGRAISPRLWRRH